ncbi:uncharacterized protein [Narcine bancroftii]|uniref:uncharacterized protein n=1 Tax=Narcine bancroftii TaxID=1343680 RepID=UPI003831A2F8
MAALSGGRSQMVHRGRNGKDWTRKVIAGGGRAQGSNLGSSEADVPQGPGGRSEADGPGARGAGGAPAPPCPPALGQRRALAANLRPCFPDRSSARRGRAVGRLSQILGVLPFYCPPLKPEHDSSAGTLSRGWSSLKCSAVGGRTNFLSTGNCAPWVETFGDSDTDTSQGLTSCGNGWNALFLQGLHDKVHSRLWIQTFQQLINSNASTLFQDSKQHHYRFSGIGALQQRRMYGHFKNEKGYFDHILPPLESNTVYYDILKVSPKATHSQIKSAYYKQSLIYHPDRNAGSDEAAVRFTQISEAYSVLGSVSLRKKYDRGILTPADLHIGKRPSDKPQVSTVKRTQAKSSEDYSDERKSKFNFDEFFKAHYGKQLEMEQLIRWRRMQLRKSRENFDKRLNLQKLIEITVIVMLFSGLVLVSNVKGK